MELRPWYRGMTPLIWNDAMEIPFTGEFVSNIYLYNWDCNYNVTKSSCSFPLFPCANILL